MSCSGTGQVAVVALAGLFLEGGTTSAANKVMLNTLLVECNSFFCFCMLRILF